MPVCPWCEEEYATFVVHIRSNPACRAKARDAVEAEAAGVR